MAGRRHGWTKAGVAVATVTLLLSGVAATTLGDDSAAVPPGTAADGSPVAARAPGPTGGPADAAIAAAQAAAAAAAAADELPLTGAFTDSGSAGVAALAGLQTWLGGTPVRVGHTYLPGDSWDDIEGDGDLLQPWADWTRAEPGRLFVLNVPMQEDNEGDVPDGQVRRLIEQGAAGADDAHFTELARRLVALGVPDTVIVLGWEMNGTTYTHRCGPDPAGWKTYWNRIVTAMRAVPGQHFRFDFAPSRGQDAIAWTRCYPGDATVDVIGMDSYDQPADESFYDQVTEPYGLQEQVDFAAEHKKAISYPEWGLFRSGDNPDYMSLMLTWITTHHPLYQTLTDYCPHGVWSCDQNPKSSKVYRALLYGRKTASAPAPAGTSATGPTPSAGPSVSAAAPTQAGGTAETCVPMPLTEALRQDYVGGRVCVRLQRRSPGTAVTTPPAAPPAPSGPASPAPTSAL
jgi:hypothetical protein